MAEISYAQCPCFSNPGFESAPANATPPSSWTACNVTPDTQPETGNPLNATSSEGNTCMGLASPDNTQGEEAGQQLCSSLTAGQNYLFTIDLARINQPAQGMTKDMALEIWGGTTSCSKDELLWTSPTITSSTYGTYCVSFTPSSNYDYIVFRGIAVSGSGSLGYILVDNITCGDGNSTINANVSSTDASCGNADGSATILVSGLTGVSYSWSTNPVQTDSIAVGLQAGNYDVIISGNNGCFLVSDTFQVNVQNSNGPIVDLTVVDNACPNSSDGSIQSSVTGGTLPYVYLWNNGQSGSSIQNLTSGNYSLTVTDANGCTQVVNATVSTQSDLSAWVVSVDTASTSAIISVSGGVSPFSFSLNGGALVSDSTLNGLQEGTNTIEVMDANGCIVTLYINLIHGLIIPNVISPNGDGKNDAFFIQNLPSGSLLELYNRWGSLIYTSSNYQNDWAAVNCSEGVYFYVLNSPLHGTFHGHVTVFQK